MSRAEPIAGDLQSFSEELEKFVTQSMARVREFCYGDHIGGKWDGKRLLGCVANEFAEVEGSGWVKSVIGSNRAELLVLFEITSLGVSVSEYIL